MVQRLVAILLVMAGLAVGDRAVAAQGFLVIVNEANPTQTITKEELSRIFLKRTTEWASGAPAVPVDLLESSQVRAAFSQAVHGRSVSAIEAYWQRQIFSGRGLPPEEKSEDEVIDFVRATPNAVGYVRNGSPLGSGVRTIRLVN